MGLDEALYSPGFYILAGGGTIAALVGYKLSKSWAEASLPVWQLIILILVIIVASAFFASRD